MCAFNFMLQALLILQAYTFAVKIGVSQLSTTSTTTLAPNTTFNDTNDAETLLTLTTTASDLETSTLVAIINDTTTTTPEFPPKITKPTKKTATLKPSTTTPKSPKSNVTSTISTANNAINSTELVVDGDALAHSNNFYCSCDLLPLTCDINCCCDRDCAKEALKVFNCFTPSKYPELRLLLEGFQYEHGLPSCKINDGWLCVFRTNRSPETKKVHEFNFDTKNNYKWSDTLMELTETMPAKERDFYKYGEQLKVFNVDTLDVQNLEIPYAYKPPFCQLNDAIRHLTSISRSCLVTSLIAAQETKLKFFNLAASTKLLSKPRSQFTDSEDLKELTKDLKLKSCIRSIGAKDYVCQEIDTLYNETESHEFENYYAVEIRIRILHNFTDLLGGQLEIMEEELLPNESPFELWQKYSVKFVAFNETATEKDKTNLRLSYSGPLGYLHGEPIIVAKFMPRNESEELSVHNRVLNYFKYPSKVNNTVSLLSQRAGLCYKNYGKDYNINYGVSSLTQCTLHVDKKRLGEQIPRSLKKANLTDVCVQLQKQILEALFNAHAGNQFNDISELYVSTLGRPQNSSDKWIPLQVQNMDFAPIVGHLASESQILSCRNILLSASYELHIGTFNEHGIARQALIKNAVLKLGQRHDLEFTLDERLEVPLILTVMFYDLSLNIGSVVGGGGGSIVCLILTIFNWQLTNFITQFK